MAGPHGAKTLRRIARAAETGADTLDFSDLTALTALPTGLVDVPSLRKLFAGRRPSDDKSTIFSNHQLADISVLDHAHNLTRLDLTNTGVTDLSALSGLTGLTALHLCAMRVSDLSALAGLTGLAELDLSDTRVADLSTLSGLTGLTRLNLWGTRVSDLSGLLHIPKFAEGTAEGLQINYTPAADPITNPHLSALSKLPPKDCAIAVVRYLKGLTPDQPPPNGTATPTLAEASPIGLTTRDGKLTAVNAGTPERLAPKELSIRLRALRDHLAALQDEAVSKQLPASIRTRFDLYAVPLAEAEPVFYLLDARMVSLKVGARNKYMTDGLDAMFVADWRLLVKMHGELKPLLLPPEEPDDLPALIPEATPKVGLTLADAAITAMESCDTVDSSVIAAMGAIKEYSILRRPM